MIKTQNSKLKIQNLEIIPPHLPKEVRQKGRGEMIWRMPTVKTLLLAVVFGFLSGVVGGMVVNTGPFDNWLWGPQASWTDFGRGVERAESRALVREALAEKAQKSLVTFYRQGQVLAKSSLPRPEDRLGTGFFVTSDGWLATVADAVGQENKKGIFVLTAEKQLLAPEEIISDPISDLVLVKVSAGGFASLPFVFNDQGEAGTPLWLASPEAGPRPSELLLGSQFSPKTRSDFYHSSERLYRLGLLKDNFARAAGSPVLTAKGEVAGILVNQASYLAASLIDSALKSVVKSKEIKRAYLGVHFLELNDLIANRQKYGVKLTDDLYHSAPAVEKKSPLLGLGLKAGDVLLSLGKETITPRRSLPDILADYAPGAKVEIRYSREGEEKTGEVELGVKILDIKY